MEAVGRSRFVCELLGNLGQAPQTAFAEAGDRILLSVGHDGSSARSFLGQSD